MQRAIKKYEIKDLGVVETVTSYFDEKIGKLVKGQVKKRHRYLVKNSSGGSCCVFAEDLKALDLDLEAVDLIDDEGEVIGQDNPISDKPKKKVIRRK